MIGTIAIAAIAPPANFNQLVRLIQVRSAWVSSGGMDAKTGSPV